MVDPEEDLHTVVHKVQELLGKEMLEVGNPMVPAAVEVNLKQDSQDLAAAQAVMVVTEIPGMVMGRTLVAAVQEIIRRELLTMGLVDLAAEAAVAEAALVLQ